MQQRQSQSGFTLIEMIVSLGVFSVVVTISVGALLVLIAANRQLQDEQTVLSNLSFALDSMTRELRTGSQYYCHSHANTNGPGQLFDNSSPLDDADTDNNYGDGLSKSQTSDCPDGRSALGHNYQGVAFVEGGDSITGTTNHRILYFFNQTDNKLYRKVANNVPQSIVSDGIHIVDAEFFVTGSAPLSTGAGEDDQAAVTIFITAAESSDASAKQYHVQSTVSQRVLDL